MINHSNTTFWSGTFKSITYLWGYRPLLTADTFSRATRGSWRMVGGQSVGKVTYAGCKKILVNTNKSIKTFALCKGLHIMHLKQQSKWRSRRSSFAPRMRGGGVHRECRGKEGSFLPFRVIPPTYRQGVRWRSLLLLLWPTFLARLHLVPYLRASLLRIWDGLNLWDQSCMFQSYLGEKYFNQ